MAAPGFRPGLAAIRGHGAASVDHKTEQPPPLRIEVERPTGLATAADILIVDTREGRAVINALPQALVVDDHEDVARSAVHGHARGRPGLTRRDLRSGAFRNVHPLG